MKLIIDFYKSLDTLNLIMFWGVIIVVILLIIFSIILINKNKKLNNIIKNKTNYQPDDEHDIPIQKNSPNKTPVKNIHTTNINTSKESNQEPINTSVSEEKMPQNNQQLAIPEEKIKPSEEKFIVEEHVMGYNTQTSNNYKTINQNQIINNQLKPVNNETNNNEEKIRSKPSQAYQKNVLRDISTQTSPINIVKKNSSINNLQAQSKETSPITNKIAPSTEPNKISEITKVSEVRETTKIDNQTIDNRQFATESRPKSNYLEELKNSLSKINEDGPTRTNYEIEQEENAIISYEELMQKKDQIKIIDEEEAVISIEELLKKQEKKDKLYQLTPEEENDSFINELKNFRNDL